MKNYKEMTAEERIQISEDAIAVDPEKVLSMCVGAIGKVSDRPHFSNGFNYESPKKLYKQQGKKRRQEIWARRLSRLKKMFPCGR